MSNLNLDCFELLFDIHIAYVGKHGRFSIFHAKRMQIFNVKKGYFLAPFWQTVLYSMCSMTISHLLYGWIKKPSGKLIELFVALLLPKLLLQLLYGALAGAFPIVCTLFAD